MNAVVTGGTRGIGLAVCKLLYEEGYAVTATYSGDEEAAKAARELLPAVHFVRADAAKEEEMQALLSRFSRIDALVCNAGVDLFSLVQDTSAADFARVMDVNAGGVFFTCKHAVKKMLGGGAIVMVSSVWGEEGGSCESAYSMSKGAVLAFSKALAKELAPSNITVNCVSPGAIDTAMNARLSPEEKRALEEEIPLGRMGTAEEVASAVLFLLKNRYITGQTLGVNGGWRM